MTKRPLLFAACVFLLGTWYGQNGSTIALLGLFAVIGYLVIHLGLLQHVKFVLWTTLAVTGFLIAYMHITQATAERDRVLGQISDGDVVTVQGEISTKTLKEDTCIYELTDCYILLEGEAVECNHIRLPLSEDSYSIREILVVTGEVNTFYESTNDGNFDQRSYYQSLQFDFQLDDAQVEAVYGEGGYEEWLYQLRIRLAESLQVICDNTAGSSDIVGSSDTAGCSDTASSSNTSDRSDTSDSGDTSDGDNLADSSDTSAGILAGMLLGDKSSLDSETKSLYQKAGISHVLAISGLHISVFAVGIYQLLRRRGAGFRFAGVVGGVFVVSYTILTGAGVSARRAAMMFLLYMLASAVRRTYDMLNGLGLAVLVLLWENPFLIGYSGLAYSLAAMLGIGCAVQTLSGGEQDEDAQMLQIRKRQMNSTSNQNDRDTSRLTKWKHSLCEAFISGFAIQASTLPLVAYYNYEVPIYAIFINLLIVPLLTPVLISGACGMLVGCVAPTVGRILVLPAVWILNLYQRICELSLALPYAQKITGRPQLWELVAYYVVFGLILYLRMRWKRKQEERIQQEGDIEKNVFGNGDKIRPDGQEIAFAQELRADEREKPTVCRRSDIGTNILETGLDNDRKQGVFRLLRINRIVVYAELFLMIIIFCRCRTPSPEVDYLDVGQGDGIFISAGDGYCCFIDGGSSNVSSLGTYRILPFLKAKGADHIDYWFVSHADSDHISGISEVLESGYPVEYLVFSYAAPQDDSLTELIEAAEAVGTEILYLNEGDQLFMGEAEITCLFPFAGMDEAEINAESADRNARSLVLRMELCGTSFLFVGDITSEEELAMVEAGVDLSADVCKIAHHGSNYSSCTEYLEAVNPAVAVISCSSTNTYGHPGEEAVARITALDDLELYYTMYGGRIRVVPGEDTVVSEFLSES